MSYIKYKKSTFFVHVSTQDYVDKFFYVDKMWTKTHFILNADKFLKNSELSHNSQKP